MADVRFERRAAIGEAAMRILANGGARGLTHRAIDRELGFPIGTTGNYFPSRSDLLRSAAAYLNAADIARLDRGVKVKPDEINAQEAADIVVRNMHALIAPGARERQIARYELLLASQRGQVSWPEAEETRAGLIDMFASVLSGVGVADPDEAATDLMAYVDGIIFDQLVNPGDPIDPKTFTCKVERFVNQLLTADASTVR